MSESERSSASLSVVPQGSAPALALIARQSCAETAEPPSPDLPDAEEGLETSCSFDDLLAILRTDAGQDFNGYKRPPLLRRTLRRMGLARVTRLAEYVALLRREPAEVVALGNDLTINVTSFFRDAEAWEALRAQGIAPWLETRGDGEPVRAWVTACASGEEAYSLAMLLAEESDRLGKRFDVKIFATDTSERFLERARNGVFPAGIERDLTAERLERFFDREAQSYRIKKALRERVVFAPQNLLCDPPFARLDLCACRNLLIYLEPAMQRRVFSLLHFALREGGTLFFGSAEISPPGAGLFEPIHKLWQIYRRVGLTRHGAVEFPIRAPAPAAIADLRSRYQKLETSSEYVISTNEELQCANEELEASKEELQLVNEELATVNGVLQEKLAELEATTNDLTHLLRSTDIAVIFLDAQLRIRRFTPAIEDLFEMIPTDVGRPIAHLAPKFAGGDLIRDAAAVLDRHVPIEAEVQSHSGRWYLRRALPYRIPGHPVDGVVIAFIDLTARKRSEDAVREAKDGFIAIVSHELRTPLQSILAVTSTLESDMPQDMLQEGLAMIERAAVAQRRLIDDLLDVSRMVSGKLKLSLRPTRLVDTVAQAVAAGSAAAAARGVTLETGLNDVGRVGADPDRLWQVVSNLVNNAVKFTPAGGRIAVGLRRRSADVEIRVEDTGEGIAAELLPHIFDRFRQGEVGTTRRHGGLGLGLAIARQLVELHGGTIEVASGGLGQGATFSVTLPLPALDEPEAPSPVESGPGAAGLRGRRILLVDDSEATRRSIALVLHAAGAQVTAVAGVEEALDSLAAARPDLLVSDIAMPGRDGYELIRKTRELELQHHLAALPALALTALARDEDRSRALEAGFQEHVAKPVEPRRLIAALVRLLVGPPLSH